MHPITPLDLDNFPREGCQKILVIGVDYRNDNDCYFWHIVRGLSRFGHHVTPIRNRGISFRAAREIYTNFEEVGAWIPRSIYGYFRDVMYFIRSIYTATWVSWTKGHKFGATQSQRIIAFSDASFVAVPILCIFGDFTVVAMELFKELLSEYDVSRNEIGLREYYMFHVRSYCLNFAERILVPCSNARELLDKRHDHVNVIYPPIKGNYKYKYEIIMTVPSGRPRSTRVFQPDMTFFRPEYRFVAIDILDPSSNFEILVDAFAKVTRHLDLFSQPLISLDLIGFEHTAQQKNYRIMLEHRISRARDNIVSSIVIYRNLEYDIRKELIEGAVAVLNANSTSIYVPSIIEGFYFKRVVISVQSEFVSHLVRDSHNGILVEDNSISFARQMLEVLMHQGTTYKVMARRANRFYEKYCSYERLIRSLELLIGSIVSEDY